MPPMLGLRVFLGLCALLICGSVDAAIGPVADLLISNEYINPDGVNRSTVLAGRTFPGPAIIGQKGDVFKINVTNTLHDNTMLQATTIHWHGIFQNGTNYADGPAMVTQCPIVPNDSFVYEFPVYQQAGTYWYHSHYASQYCDGLRGAFVVYDPDDPYQDLYDFDNETTIITLADWYHEPAPSRTQKPVATLINGLGRAENGTATDLAVINVQQGKRYRFRVIGLSCDPSFNFTIHNHKLTVIEADGEYTAPLVVDSIEVWAGQRYSVIVNADQPIGNYWLRANPYFSRGRPGFENGRNSAIFRYLGALEEEPTSTGISTRPLQEVNLHSIFDTQPPGNPWPGGADVNIPIRHAIFHDPPDFKPRFEVNNHTFTSPSVPILLQILNGTYDAESLLPKGSVYKLPPNKSIELVIYGSTEDGGPHPWHLHGHSFYVVRSGLSKTYNWVNPVRRDTVDTGLDDGETTIRFFTDNAATLTGISRLASRWSLPKILKEQTRTPNLGPSFQAAFDQLCPRFYANDPDSTNHSTYPE
ncbi:hypothetical protein DXG01_015673 [Tephrocybe rancida]|nr:hypothetical protein DXG01_015673 [Tephrocybe rancida]